MIMCQKTTTSRLLLGFFLEFISIWKEISNEIQRKFLSLLHRAEMDRIQNAGFRMPIYPGYGSFDLHARPTIASLFPAWS
jgi:hypothetical protein